MKVAEVSMSKWDARQKWLEYRKAVRKNKNADDDALRKAYRFLSQGRRVLSLHEVMRTAGLDEQHRPKLAIAKAHWSHCFHFYSPGGRALFSAFQSASHAAMSRRQSIELVAGTFAIDPHNRHRIGLKAIVPTIPPALRPAGRLDGYCILWEAEWVSVPTDPLLLRPLGRDLYLVCAQWDLTPLERSILFQKV